MEKIMIFGIAALIGLFVLDGKNTTKGPVVKPPVQIPSAIDKPNVRWIDPRPIPVPPRITIPIHHDYLPKEPCKD